MDTRLTFYDFLVHEKFNQVKYYCAIIARVSYFIFYYYPLYTRFITFLIYLVSYRRHLALCQFVLTKRYAWSCPNDIHNLHRFIDTDK